MSAYLRLIVMGSKASSIMDWNSYHQRISLPSENFTSVFVMQTVGSVMTNKYSEGYPDPRYYGGNGYINMAESLYQKHAFEAFRLDPVKWGGKSQPNSPTIRPEEREKTFAAQLKMKRKYCSPSETSPKRENGSPTKQKEKESKGSAQPEQLVPKANEKEIRFFGRWLQAFLGCLEGKFQERKEGGCHLISERANQGAVNDLYLFLFHAIKD